MEIKEFGLYIIDDEYLNNYYIKEYPQNRATGERPFFACFKDKTVEDIYWIIPISSQVDKYREIIRKYPNAGLITILYNNKESAILTQNIVPINKKFILREFTVNGVHYRIMNRTIKTEILKKAKKVKALIENNRIYNSESVMELYEKMKSISEIESNAETKMAIDEVERLKNDPNRKSYASFSEMMEDINEE